MRLSTRSRYGVRLMLQLAANYRDGGVVRLAEIAKRQSVSVKYLEQIVLPLKLSGYVTSYRGARGGHKLARHPGEISVGEVVALMEESVDVVECAGDPDICERSGECVTRRLWKDASEAFYRKLDATTFQDLLEQVGESGDELQSPCLPLRRIRAPGKKTGRPSRSERG